MFMSPGVVPKEGPNVGSAANTRIDGKIQKMKFFQSYLLHSDEGATRARGSDSHIMGHRTKDWTSDKGDKYSFTVD